ncbi:tRNA 2-thiouridine(34) synthase MnmA [Marispirochaeta sp.]|jgi:tRNA-uridine 2-sulfurtransferase|uniref:tRNA 2-thiouridine(34) synthase MnmA n=1 Tax=Marispirochaeta sp. TaxID=2038653 RepID=UPI0029C669B3|nr:tRNA 2-thiouridine(34) synthase MnmA [Marispirochaeta sp.]
MSAFTIDSDTPVAVGMSGGVDSSVAAFLLQKHNSRLVGVSHYIWPDGDCCSAELLARAREACAHLGISYIIEDLQEEFTEAVVGDFVASYLEGKTPNPCVRCNQRLRFSAFYRRLETRLLGSGFLAPGESLKMATGHYVRVEDTDEGLFLRRGLDTRKDQSYMLYQIPKELLPNFVFPLGKMKKTEVVALAKEHGLPSAAARESQDACFVHGHYGDFIAGFTGSRRGNLPGEIVDTSGNLLGNHKGYINYTIGQRQGLGLGNGPWFVVAVDPVENRVIVGRREELGTREFGISGCNWFFRKVPADFEGEVKIRYNSPGRPCRVRTGEDSRARVTLSRQEAVTPGQSAVFYRDGLVLGGGIID